MEKTQKPCINDPKKATDRLVHNVHIILINLCKIFITIQIH